MLGKILDYVLYIGMIPAFLLVVSFLVIVLRTRARVRRERGSFGTETELGSMPVIKDATEADEIALSIIERYKKRIWRRFSINTAFGIAPTTDLCGSLVSEIAHVYYPDSPRPELEATINDLLDLNERVIARARRLLDKFPLSRLQGVRLCQILSCHRIYTSVTRHVLFRSVRHKWARRAASSVAAVARHADPRFWITRGLTRGGREFAARYFLTSLVTIAGEEAILLYRRTAAEPRQPEELP